MIKTVTGDLLNATEQYIAHQANCVSVGSAAGLAYYLFSKYPYADVYLNRKERSVPGTISIHGDGQSNRYIINMYAQFYPGHAKTHLVNDTSKLREEYFKKCLDSISQIPAISSLAIPYGIGCGLAGGNWNHYYQMLLDFSEKSQLDIVIYQK